MVRVWTIHPKYLDPKGIQAVWRDTLLLQELMVNPSKTGYITHPQYKRRIRKFYRKYNNLIIFHFLIFDRWFHFTTPIDDVGYYLRHVYFESQKRNHNFVRGKILRDIDNVTKHTVTFDQLQYELEHLKRKCITRDPQHYERIESLKLPYPHPLFSPILGEVEAWEQKSYYDVNPISVKQNLTKFDDFEFDWRKYYSTKNQQSINKM